MRLVVPPAPLRKVLQTCFPAHSPNRRRCRGADRARGAKVRGRGLNEQSISAGWEEIPGETSTGTSRPQFVAALLFACAWLVFSIWVSQRWLIDLAALTHPLFALFALTFIAYVPGFMNAFLLVSLVFEPGAKRRPQARYPGVSVLVAAYQEEAAIAETIISVRDVGYPGRIELLVLDDGSADGTSAMVDYCRVAHCGASPGLALRLLRFDQNRGKARVLNCGLGEARHDLIVTIDADTRPQPGSLTAIVEHLLSAPAETAATAGTVFVGNAHDSLVTGAQEWDYFHGIAAVKRMQSMYGGTLVAQGAFSIYRRQALLDIGGWPETVGEDIVLTWALLKQGYRIGYAEDAIAWTQAPVTFAALARQRKRWARGMIEALSHHGSLLFQPRLRTMFIWWNILFISLDLTFTAVFLPGLVLALFGIYWLAGPLTLLVLPLAALWNLVIFRIQTRMVKRAGVEMRRSRRGFAFFALAYPLFMQPVSLWGYAAEMCGLRKEWGRTMTKMGMVAASIALAARPALAGAEPAAPRAGVDFFYSADSDRSEVVKAAFDLDLRSVGENRYLGIGLEKAWFNPGDSGWRTSNRVYLRAADEMGGWQWKARIGTDGDTVIGSLSVNDTAAMRKELFVERDIVETRQGLQRGIYATFVGAAIDLPADDRNVFTALAGVQPFTGRNVRLHLRGSYVHVLSTRLGLSVQLRGRYFHSSMPAEFDYYSPRWHAELLPVVQMRRFVGGWELLGAAGLGAQRDFGAGWRSSRYAHASVRSPVRSSRWAVKGEVIYTNTPSISGTSQSGYSYVQFNLGVSRRF